MRTIVLRACVIGVAVASGTPVFVSAQSQFPISRSVQLQAQAAPATAAQQPAPAPRPQTPTPSPAGASSSQVRRLTSDEAVQLAVQNNLGIQIARVNPQIEDLNVLQARTGWTPAFSSTIQSNSNNSPNQNFLAGAQGTRTSQDQFQSNFGVQQLLPWGGT